MKNSKNEAKISNKSWIKISLMEDERMTQEMKENIITKIFNSPRSLVFALVK